MTEETQTPVEGEEATPDEKIEKAAELVGEANEEAKDAEVEGTATSPTSGNKTVAELEAEGEKEAE